MLKSTKKLALGAALGALLATPAVSNAATQWSMATAWGGGPFLKDENAGAEGYARLVEKLTGGSIKIQVFPGGTLGKALKVSDTVKSGVAQIGHTWMGYDWGIDKTAVALSGMAGGLQPEEMMMWLWYAGGAELSNEFRKEKFGIIGIPCGIFPTEIFLHSKVKVETLADYKKIKQRTAGAWAEIGGRLGASTVILPGAEVYPALERGVIDATEWSSPSLNLPSGFHKIAKYVVTPGIHQPAAVQECVVNMQAYDKLTDSERESLWLAARIHTLNSWGDVAYKDMGALDEMRKSGNEFVRLSPEFIAAAKEASEMWADEVAKENPWFKKAIEHRRAFQNKLKAGWSYFRFPMGTASEMMK